MPTKLIPWWVLMLPTSLGAGAIVAANPTGGLVLFGLPWVIWVTLTRPKVGASLFLFLMLGGLTFERITRLSFLGYADEASALLAISLLPVSRLLAGKRLRRFPGSAFLAVFLASGFLSSALHSVPVSLAVGGSFLFLKGPLLGIGFAQVDWSSSDLKRIRQMGFGLFVAVGVATVLDVASPTLWENLLNPYYFDRRGGSIPTTIAIFATPGMLGQFAALAGCVFVGLLAVEGNRVRNRMFLVAAVVMQVMTFRRRTLIAEGVSLMMMRLRMTWRPRAGVLVGAVLVAGPLLIVTRLSFLRVINKTWEEYIQNPEAARVLLYRGAITIARDYFPFGAGFSRYGSYLSGVHYSPEYVRLGFTQVWGLSAEWRSGQFFTDTFWPGILGESGVVGLVAYAMALGLLARTGRLAARGGSGTTRVLGIILVGWSWEYAIESLASPVYSGPPLFGALFALGGILAVLCEEKLPGTSSLYDDVSFIDLPGVDGEHTSDEDDVKQLRRASSVSSH